MRKSNNVFWGVFLVLGGVVILLSQLLRPKFLGLWTIAAAVLLIGLLIMSISQRNMSGASFSGAFLYWVLQRPLHLPHISLVLLVLVALLVGWGLSLLVRKNPPPVPQNGATPHYGPGPRPQATNVQGGSEDYPIVRVQFSGQAHYVHSRNFTGGQFFSSFGSLDVYFSDAVPASSDMQVYVDCNFGEIKLYVPRHWQVMHTVYSSMGDIKMDTSQQQVAENPPVLHLTGNVSMGAIRVLFV